MTYIAIQPEPPLGDPPVNILLVDDDELDRESVCRMLAKSLRQNFVVDEAKDFLEAESKIQVKHYDSFLIDYYLGERTGVELVKEIHKKDPFSSVILLTGLDETAIDKEAMRAGASDYLCKDQINEALLARTIEYSVHSNKLARERDFQSHHDSLTKLVNRKLFFDRLQHAVERSTRCGYECALLYIDVDRFKLINDDFGHEAGDKLLCDVAERFKNTVRTSDTIARLGGDEFAILLEDIGKAESHFVSQKILRSIDIPFTISDSLIDVSISIGMTRFPNHTKNVNQLLKQADQALYLAKKDGKKTYRKYNDKLQKQLDRSKWLEHEFKIALKNGEIRPYYQPQYSLNTGVIIGFESLARWQHPVEGLISPGEFIPIAEKLSLITALTKTMIEKSATDFLALKTNYPSSRVAINISATDCNSDGLLSTVKKVTGDLGIYPSEIELEMTESVFMHDVDNARTVLNELHELGVRIAIDDFGTGFSSLSYLAELPIDVLKIDISFVQGIGISSQKESIIKVIIDLANRLNIELVGEGVETQEQADFLRICGCQNVQGYHYSKPLPLEELLSLSIEN